MAKTPARPQASKPRPTYGAQPSPGQAQLIQDLGGPTLVAKLCAKLLNYAYTPQAICMWKKRGIPPNYKPEFAAEARRRGVKVPADY